MTIINQKSISGITSITFASAGDDLLTFHSNNGTERFRIDNSGNTKITAGIVTTQTVTGNGTVGGTIGVTGNGTVGGTLGVTGQTTFATYINLGDSDKAKFGASGDLEIYHNGTHSYIADEGSGELNISGSRIQLMNAARSEKALDFVQDGAVDIYYDGSRKFSTKSDGIDVTGEVQCNSVDVDGGHINLESGYSLQWGDSHERIEQSDTKLEFFTNNSEKMTLSGSNLGLGTNSNLNGLLTLHQNDDQLFLKQSDGDSGFLLGSNNTNGNLNLKRRSAGSNTTIATFRAAGGLTFNGDTAAANALDDYEEGNWTPSFSSGGWSGLTVNTAKYVKIGAQVFAQCYVSAFTGSSSAQALQLGGLPFNSISNGYVAGSVDIGEGSIKGTYIRVESSSGTIGFYYPSENISTSRTTLKGNQIGNDYIILGITYFTNS